MENNCLTGSPRRTGYAHTGEVRLQYPVPPPASDFEAEIGDVVGPMPPGIVRDVSAVMAAVVVKISIGVTVTVVVRIGVGVTVAEMTTVVVTPGVTVMTTVIVMVAGVGVKVGIGR